MSFKTYAYDPICKKCRQSGNIKCRHEEFKYPHWHSDSCTCVECDEKYQRQNKEFKETILPELYTEDSSHWYRLTAEDISKMKNDLRLSDHGLVCKKEKNNL